ncbi:unnamed protein product [Symbiodinium sp. CCMP2592]|nr:unnamed protein product [Symbiodinium sp. CCMP2592]
MAFTTVVVENNYVSRWMAPLLALCLQFEVGTKTEHDLVPLVFEFFDPRCDSGDQADSVSVAGPPCLGCKEGPTLELRASECYECPPVQLIFRRWPRTELPRHSCLQQRPHPVPFQVSLSDGTPCIGNRWRRELSRSAGLLPSLSCIQVCRPSQEVPFVGAATFGPSLASHPALLPVRSLGTSTVNTTSPLPALLRDSNSQEVLHAQSQPVRSPRTSTAPVHPLPNMQDCVSHPDAGPVRAPAGAHAACIEPALPNLLAYSIAAPVPVDPPSVYGGGYTQPVIRMGLITEADLAAQGRQYTVFEYQRRPRVRNFGTTWSLQDLVADAIRAAANPIRHVRVLDPVIPGYPAPQLRITRSLATSVPSRAMLSLRNFRDFTAYSGGWQWLCLHSDPGQPAGQQAQANADQVGTTTTATASRVLPGATPQQLLQLAAEEEAVPYHQPGAGLYPACVAFQPDFLRQPEVVHRPLADLCLFAGLQTGTGCLDFTVHVAGAAPTTLQAYSDWSLASFFHAAIGAIPELPQAVQMLVSGVPGLPEPQFVLTAAGATSPAVPVDFRFVGGPIATVCATQADSIEHLLQFAPGLEMSEHVQELLLQRDLFLQDARGGVHTAVPGQAADLQWLRVVSRAGIIGSTAMMPSPLTSLTSTSTTTTAMQGEATTVRLTLTGAGLTMTTAAIPLQQFDVVSELTTLILAITRAGRLPDNAHVVITAAWPLPAGGRHFNIPVLVYSPDDYQYIVLDPSVDGSQVHSLVVQAGTMPEHVLSRNQENLGFVAWVNGAPQSAVRRPLRTGDFVQIFPGDTRVIYPVGHPLQLMGHVNRLHCLSAPFRVPAFNTIAARASHAGANAEVRQALLGAIDRAMRARVELYGLPSRTRQKVVLLEPGRAPHIVWLDLMSCPSVDEAEPLLRDLGLFSDDARILDSRIETLVAQVFVIAPREVRGMTYTVPNPIFFGAHTLIHLPADTSPPWHLLPVQDQYTLVPPSEGWIDGAGILVARPQGQRSLARMPASSSSEVRAVPAASTAAAPIDSERTSSAASKPMSVETVPSSGGTSLAQLPDFRQAQQRRCRQAEAKGLVSTNCPCVAGQVQCDPDTAERSAQPHTVHELQSRVRQPVAHLAANITMAQTSIATPFGRRSLSAAAGRTADNLSPVCSVDDPGSNSLRPQGPVGHPVPQRMPVHVRLEGAIQPPEPNGSKDLTAPTLELAKAIPQPQREASLLFAVPADILAPTLAAFDLSHCHRALPASQLLHPAARQLVYGLPTWAGAKLTACMLFLDGAYENGRCTWAVAAAVEFQGTWFWAGYFCGHVAGSLSPRSAFEGELYAQFVAHGIAARHAVPCAIFYDNTSAASVAVATAATTASTQLGSATAALRFLSMYSQVPIAYQHVKSHQGHAGNETADSIAKALLKERIQPCLPADDTLDACVLAGDFDWLWIHAASATCSSWPSIGHDGDSVPICPTQAGPILTTPAAWQPVVPEPALPAKKSKCSLRCLTYNTLSCTSALQRRCLSEFMRAKKDFRVIFSQPRLLVVLLHHEGFKAAFIVGHAPDSTQDAPTREDWWEQLDARLDAIPSYAEAVIVDANARYNSHELPDNANAVSFQQLCRKHCLHRTAAHDANGKVHKTWRSPQGVWSCLDYIAVPLTCQHTLRELGAHEILDTHAGIDHQPVLAEFVLQHQSPPKARRRIDADRLRSPEGHSIIRECFLTLPECPWHLSPDEHLQVINQHIQACIGRHFSGAGAVGRKPGISEQTLELLATKRGLRRVHQRRTRQQCRATLFTCFRAWSRGGGHGSAPDTWGYAPRAWDQMCARHIADMQRISRELRLSSSRDEAAFSRAMFKEARGKGPACLAALLRSVLKVGRRYKAPRIANAIVDKGCEVTDPAHIRRLFGQHFGDIEGARPGMLSDMTQLPCEDRSCAKKDIHGIPSLPALSAAFAALQPRRAAGITGIPAEFYSACPDLAAMHHLPLVLKAASRHQTPTLWRGLLAVPLPKPGKPGHLLTGYRSIALMEPSIKAVAKAARPELLRAFERITLSSVGGARSRVPTELPELLQFNCTWRGCGGILFPVEPQVLHRFLSHLDERGALTHAGVPSALCDVLQCLLSKTWFTTDPGCGDIQCTTQGTTPGAPLADLLFQYALNSVLAALTEHLADEQLSAQLTVTGHDPALSDPVSWLDDVAVLLQSQSAGRAAGDAARATALIHQYLSLIGIGLNLSQGKTEAIVAWHGAGAHEARLQVMQRAAGTVPLHVPGHAGLVLRCVTQYEHLGSLRTAGGDIGPAVEHRHREARSVYRAVKTRLLPNPNLSLRERQALVHALILSRFLHGAGTWLFCTNDAWDGFVSRYLGLLRGAIRPLHGCSSGRLSQVEVCALTNALLPEEVLAVARVRLLACVANQAGLFAKRQFTQHAAWMQQLRADLTLVADRTKDPGLARYASSDLPTADWLDSWPLPQACVKNLLARFRRGCVASREHFVESAIAKAQAHERVIQAGLTFIRDVRCSARELRYQCPDCPALFATRAAAAAHRSKVHGHLSASAQAFGTACEVCRRQYWSTARLAEHFRKAPHCAAVYRESDMAGSVTEAIADRRVPCAQLVGPQPWWATMAHAPLTPLIPSPDANDPLPSLLALSPTRQLHSFFQLFACSVEKHGHDGVMEALTRVVSGTEHWRLAVSVAQVLDRADEMLIFQEGSLAAAYRNGALLFGPAEALRSAVARDWPFL